MAELDTTSFANAALKLLQPRFYEIRDVRSTLSARGTMTWLSYPALYYRFYYARSRNL